MEPSGFFDGLEGLLLKGSTRHEEIVCGVSEEMCISSDKVFLLDCISNALLLIHLGAGEYKLLTWRNGKVFHARRQITV